jgi:hypothetical protein
MHGSQPINDKRAQIALLLARHDTEPVDNLSQSYANRTRGA